MAAAAALAVPIPSEEIVDLDFVVPFSGENDYTKMYEATNADENKIYLQLSTSNNRVLRVIRFDSSNLQKNARRHGEAGINVGIAVGIEDQNKTTAIPIELIPGLDIKIHISGVREIIGIDKKGYAKQLCLTFKSISLTQGHDIYSIFPAKIIEKLGEPGRRDGKPKLQKIFIETEVPDYYCTFQHSIVNKIVSAPAGAGGAAAGAGGLAGSKRGPQQTLAKNTRKRPGVNISSEGGKRRTRRKHHKKTRSRRSRRR